jgi:hypothetical protein
MLRLCERAQRLFQRVVAWFTIETRQRACRVEARKIPSVGKPMAPM